MLCWGARTATYRNVLRSRYETTFLPIAEAVLGRSDLAILQFDDLLDEILMVRLFDSLGPQFVSGTTRPIADVLQEKAGRPPRCPMRYGLALRRSTRAARESETSRQCASNPYV